nr:hypothetical protein CFP56_50879 [Quercus suber]
MQDVPACPINKKNQTLPVTFNNSGIAYAGFLKRSTTPYKTPQNFLDIQEISGSERYGRGVEGVWSRILAALAMNGVVSPQAMPTRRNPMIHRQMGGEGSVEVGSEAMS